MSRFGIIYCCYGNPEYIQDCLKPWIESKQKHNILIAAVHGQFKEYHDLGIEDKDLETETKLYKYLYKGIDNLYVQNSYARPDVPIYQTEAEIRDKGLQWLLDQNCDFIWLLDNDEFYTTEQINKIIKFITNDDNVYTGWFSINFKNYVFDGKQWIDGFSPPRIFRTKLGSCVLKKCYWDNDFLYINGLDQEINYKNMPSSIIPKKWAHIKHLTWLHTNGAQKEKYQRAHFNGICSYKFNYETNKLEFDLEYYKKYNLSLPDVHYDN